MDDSDNVQRNRMMKNIQIKTTDGRFIDCKNFDILANAIAKELAANGEIAKMSWNQEDGDRIIKYYYEYGETEIVNMSQLVRDESKKYENPLDSE